MTLASGSWSTSAVAASRSRASSLRAAVARHPAERVAEPVPPGVGVGRLGDRDQPRRAGRVPQGRPAPHEGPLVQGVGQLGDRRAGGERPAGRRRLEPVEVDPVVAERRGVLGVGLRDVVVDAQVVVDRGEPLDHPAVLLGGLGRVALADESARKVLTRSRSSAPARRRRGATRRGGRPRSPRPRRPGRHRPRRGPGRASSRPRRGPRRPRPGRRSRRCRSRSIQAQPAAPSSAVASTDAARASVSRRRLRSSAARASARAWASSASRSRRSTPPR